MISPFYSFRSFTDLGLCVSAVGQESFQHNDHGLCTIKVAGFQYTVNFDNETVSEGWSQKLRRFFQCGGLKRPTVQDMAELFFPSKGDTRHFTEPAFAQWVVDRQRWRAAGGLDATLERQGELAPFAWLGEGSYGKVESVFVDPAGSIMVRKIPLRSDRPLNGELDIMSQLRHPNIVQAWPNLDRDNAILMENAGVSLYNLCDKPMLGLSREQFFSCCEQILEAVAYLHSANIVHRDIKPDNILIDPCSGWLRLTDFGFALDLGVSEYSRSDCCTPAFAAPELIYKQPYRMTPDMYSVGCTLYEMYSGKLFRSSSEPYLAEATQVKAYIEASIVIDDAPAFSADEHAQFVELLVAMLEYDPNRRITAGQALAQLRTLFFHKEACI